MIRLKLLSNVERKKPRKRRNLFGIDAGSDEDSSRGDEVKESTSIPTDLKESP